MSKTYVKEIFSSIQGEGLYVGEKHLFIRFCGCNLNCEFCDTDFSYAGAVEYDVDDLINKVLEYSPQTISLTGGEPLLHSDFLAEFLPAFHNAAPEQKIYLETNGTLYAELPKIIDFVDIIAMDVKLESATLGPVCYNNSEKFLEVATQKEVFVKVIFDENLRDEEIEAVSRMASKFNVPLILQPKMPLDVELDLEKVFYKFDSLYPNIRLIPQMHKFLNLP